MQTVIICRDSHVEPARPSHSLDTRGDPQRVLLLMGSGVHAFIPGGNRFPDTAASSVIRVRSVRGVSEATSACRVDPEQRGPHASGEQGLLQFLLHAPHRSIQALGCRANLPAGVLSTLAARSRAFFAAPRAGPALLVGAIPFDPDHHDALFQPDALAGAAFSAADAPVPRLQATVVAEPDSGAYAHAVQNALQRMRDGGNGLQKVVLARSLRVDSAQPIVAQTLAARLATDASVATYLVPLPAEAGAEPAWLVGATPELLVSRRGHQVLSHPLAGSARRSSDPLEDQRAAQSLLASAKDHDEHRHVVDAIVAALKPLCTQVQAAAQPGLHATASMWHLGTRIQATLRDAATSVTELVARLHPTPAVCGTPPSLALRTIRELEPAGRGFYAGAVGWTDAGGDGDWYVAIRCARLQGRQLRLHAGAGIVAGSEPAAEVAETAAKFIALLSALGVQEPRHD